MMFSNLLKLLSVEALTMGAKGAYPAIVNDFNLCVKDSFEYCLQFQHSVYRDHSNIVME